MGGPRGRLISSSDRLKVITLIDEARKAGARLEPCCRVLDISERTYQRWVKDGSDTQDKRKGAIRKPPSNKLSTEEKREILSICNGSEYVDLSPAQIVPKLADKGYYIASESSFYRV